MSRIIKSPRVADSSVPVPDNRPGGQLSPKQAEMCLAEAEAEAARLLEQGAIPGGKAIGKGPRGS